MILSALAFIFLFLFQKKEVVSSQTETIISENIEDKIEFSLIPNDSLSYSERLNKTKEFYPFKSWRENFFEYDMEQYTEENCNTAKQIFDDLIAELIEIGEDGNEQDKVKYFEKAVISLNDLENKEEGIIETGEREDLCELIDQITLAAGLNPKNYADGEGLADLWRDW